MKIYIQYKVICLIICIIHQNVNALRAVIVSCLLLYRQKMASTDWHSAYYIDWSYIFLYVWSIIVQNVLNCTLDTTVMKRNLLIHEVTPFFAKSTIKNYVGYDIHF